MRQVWLRFVDRLKENGRTADKLLPNSSTQAMKALLSKSPEEAMKAGRNSE